jgi:thioesterase domain-containing protein
VELFARIQAAFGQNLPLMLLFQVGSVEAIAEILRGREKPSHPQGIVPIRPEGSGVPIFIISAGLYLRELLLALSPGRQMYGLEPVENGEKILLPSIQETARIYYRNLVDFYPEGPYLLLGHSAQGFFALEVARLLIKAGKEVAFLGLIDTFPPGPKRQASPIDRVKIHILNLQDKNPAEILQYFQHSFQRFLARRSKKAGEVENLIERYEQEGRADERWKIILHAHEPEPFEGKVTYFSCTQRLWYERWDPLEPWRKYLTGQVDMVPIPGDHMSSLRPPHVAVLAEKINTLLAQF